MADLDEAAWQHMQQEAAHKLHCLQGHDLFLVTMCRIPPAKSNLTVFEAKQSTVGDGYAVRVMSQVLNDMPRACQGLLAVWALRIAVASRRRAYGAERAAIRRKFCVMAAEIMDGAIRRGRHAEPDIACVIDRLERAKGRRMAA